MLSTIWDVYNHLKKERDIARHIIQINEESKAERYYGGTILPEIVMNTIGAHERFLTQTLAAIDVGQGRPTEADE